jgi:predicted Abi (CAAX) family protease
LSIFFRPIEIGVQTQIKVAIDPDLERDTGRYFAYCKVTTPASSATDYNLAKWLWEKSAELTGLEVQKN